jgi:hypothetical protein
LAPHDDETDEEELETTEHHDGVQPIGSLPGRNTGWRTKKDVHGKR